MTLANRLRNMVADRGALATVGLASLALRLAGLGSTFVLGVILARTLGPTDYGIYGLVISVSALAMNLALLGTPQLAVRELAIRSARGDWTGARRLVLAFGRATALMCAALMVVSVVAAVILRPGDNRVLATTAIGALITAATCVSALIASCLRGLGQMSRGQFVDLVGRPTMALVLFGLALLAGWALGVVSSLVVQLLVAIAGALVSVAWLRDALSLAPGEPLGVERGWLANAIPLGIVDVLRQLDGTYGIILMGWLATGKSLGNFRVALASVVLVSMPATILHIVLAPTVSRLYRFGRRDELQSLLRLASGGMVLAVGTMLAGLILVGRQLVLLVFGTAYAEAWMPIVLLSTAQLALGLFGMGPILLAMADSERQLTRIYMMSVAIGVAAAVPLIFYLGAIGAAAAQFFSTGLIAYLSGRFARRRLGLGTTFLTRGLSAPNLQA